jgi:hypothetical protein
MKNSTFLFTIIIPIILGMTIQKDSPKLKVSVSINDKMDKIKDADIGGDDDLWTASDFKVYKIKAGKFKNEIIRAC